MADRDLVLRIAEASESHYNEKKLKRERDEQFRRQPLRHFVISFYFDGPGSGGTVFVNGQQSNLEVHRILDLLQPDILGCTETPRTRTWTVRVKNFDERSKTVESLKEFMKSF